MKKILLIISGLIFSVNAVNAQLGVGTPLPNTSSQLDVVATNKGILIPRVSLTGSTDATTIANGNVNSLLVFNTQTISDITPGYYYWYTNKWNALRAAGTETLTSQSFDPVTGILTYKDENGTTTSLNLSAMVPNFETLTSVAFVPVTGILTYNDEKGLPTVMDLSTIVPNFETLTSAAFVPATGILTYNDEKGIATNMDLSGLSINNWQVDLTTTKATLNTQNIYQMGNVGIGTNTIIPNVALDVRGALRSGASHGGVVGVNSAAFGTSTSAEGLNAIAFGETSAAAGSSSIAGGTFSSVDVGASNSISFGFTTVAYGSGSAAFGVLNQTRGNRSFVNGSSNIATSFGETVVGYSNAIRTIGNVTTVTLTDPVFQVGNGNDVGSVFSNALTILKNGNTGIGIAGVEAAAKPTERLDIGSGNLRVRDINTNVGLGTENIVVADATGIFKTVAGTTINNNNWLVDLTTDKASLNTQNVYQMGNVGIGTNTITPNVAFDVRGAVRGGSVHNGTVGVNSLAFGDNNIASAINSIAVGSFTQANEEESFAGGRGSTVAVGANDGFAYGFANEANGPQSVAFGAGTKANGYQSFTNGGGTVATSFSETAIGLFNAIRIGNASNVTSTDPLFQIGNGAVNGSVLSNALTVLKNGNTGIGIAGVEAAAKPTERLDIGSGNLRVRDINTNVGLTTDNIVVADATGILKTVAGSSLAGNNWQAIGNTGTTPGTNFIGTNDAQDFVVKTNANEVVRVTQTGNVGIGTATPTNKLEITAATANSSGLTFTNLNSTSPGDATVTTPLGVNATGTVVAMLPDTRYAVRQVAANYTVILTDETILVDNTGGSVIITLPAEVCIIGKRYNVVKKNTSANTINVVSAAGITVAGLPSRIVGATIVLQYDGESNWLLLQ